jgi:hypothetical protein
MGLLSSLIHYRCVSPGPVLSQGVTPISTLCEFRVNSLPLLFPPFHKNQ